MFTKEFEKVTVHFGPLIIWIGLILMIFLIQLVRSINLESKFKKVSNSLMDGKYNDIIEVGKRLLYSYQKYNKRLSTAAIISKIEYLNFALAISHFAMNNDEEFLKHINDLTQNHDIKEFWLALYYLQKEDFENAEEHYAKISITEEPSTNITYLDSIKLYKQGECDSAKAKVTEIYGNLKHVVLKQFADEVLKSE